METTTKIKIYLKKILPHRFFLLIVSVYRKLLRFTPPSPKRFLLVFFTGKHIKKLLYKNIAYTLELDKNNGLLDKRIFLDGPFEPHILDTFVSVVREGDVCIDVGANIGHHSIFLAKLVGPTGKVFSFEPIEKLVQQIQHSADLNGMKNITVFPVAAGDKSYKTTIHINEGVIGSSSILGGMNNDSFITTPIEIRTIDEMILPLPLTTIRLIKIDVEGFEYFALQGAVQTLKKYTPDIVLEFSPDYYRRTESSHTSDILTLLEDLNYECYDLENNNKKVTHNAEFLSEFAENLRSQTNLLCQQKK